MEDADTPSLIKRGAERFRKAQLHVGGVLGAVGLAAVAAELGVNWQGVIAELVDVWGSVIRPVGKAVISVLMYPLELMLGRDIELPQLVSDYVAIGVVLGVSMLRAWTTLGEAPGWKSYLTVMPLSVTFWPVLFLVMPLMVLDYLEDRHRLRVHRGVGRYADKQVRAAAMAKLRYLSPDELAFDPSYFVKKSYFLTILPLIYLAVMILLDLLLSLPPQA